MERSLEYQRKKEIANNIILKGLGTDGDEKEKVCSFLTQKFQIDTNSIAEVSYTRRDKNIIIVKLNSAAVKEKIMKNRSNSLVNLIIYIENDTTSEERRMKKKKKSESMLGRKIKKTAK